MNILRDSIFGIHPKKDRTVQAMKVALAIDTPNYFGGGNKFTADLIHMLKTIGYEVALCAWAKPVEGSCYREFLDVENVYLPSAFSKLVKGKLLRIVFSTSSSLKRCIRDFGPNIIINANVEPGVFRGVENIPKVQYCHFPTELKLPKQDLVHLVYRIPYWYWHYRELGKMDAVVCNSRYTEHIAYLLWKYHVPKERFHVIYPAVDVKVFKGELERENKICYVGRIDVNKGIDHVIDSFLKLPQELGVSLSIVGGVTQTTWSRDYFEMRLKPRVQKLMDEGYPVRLICDVPYSEIVQTLMTSKAMLSFNPEEHFGIVPVEAQAAGCPPIVAEGGGQEETVKQGVTGFLARTPEDLTQYLSKLLVDGELWQKMSRAARESAQSFSIEKVSKEWEALLEGLVRTA